MLIIVIGGQPFYYTLFCRFVSLGCTYEIHFQKVPLWKDRMNYKPAIKKCTKSHFHPSTSDLGISEIPTRQWNASKTTFIFGSDIKLSPDAGFNPINICLLNGMHTFVPTTAALRAMSSLSQDFSNKKQRKKPQIFN